MTLNITEFVLFYIPSGLSNNFCLLNAKKNSWCCVVIILFVGHLCPSLCFHILFPHYEAHDPFCCKRTTQHYDASCKIGRTFSCFVGFCLVQLWCNFIWPTTWIFISVSPKEMSSELRYLSPIYSSVITWLTCSLWSNDFFFFNEWSFSLFLEEDLFHWGL